MMFTNTVFRKTLSFEVLYARQGRRFKENQFILCKRINSSLDKNSVVEYYSIWFTAV